MTCRRCGCSEFNPCLNSWGEACAWIAPGLCTFCATQQEFELAEFCALIAVAHEIGAHLPKYTMTERREALRLYRQATTSQARGAGA